MSEYNIGDRVVYRNRKFIISSLSRNNFGEQLATLYNDDVSIKSFVSTHQLKPIITCK